MSHTLNQLHNTAPKEKILTEQHNFEKTITDWYKEKSVYFLQARIVLLLET